MPKLCIYDASTPQFRPGSVLASARGLSAKPRVPSRPGRGKCKEAARRPVRGVSRSRPHLMLLAYFRRRATSSARSRRHSIRPPARCSSCFQAGRSPPAPRQLPHRGESRRSKSSRSVCSSSRSSTWAWVSTQSSQVKKGSSQARLAEVVFVVVRDRLLSCTRSQPLTDLAVIFGLIGHQGELGQGELVDHGVGSQQVGFNVNRSGSASRGLLR